MSQSLLRSTILALAMMGLSSLPAAAQNTGEAVGDTMTAAQVQRIDVRFPPEILRIGRSVGPLRVAKLDILVQTDGKAGDVKLVTSSGFDPYDRAAVEAARNATYLPAVQNGMAVESRLNYDVSFGLLCNRAAGNATCDNGRFPTTCSATVCERLTR
jgi:TonB family protein